jgi:PEP-CTERM motif
MFRGTRRFFLAGASALAIMAGAADADADIFTVPGEYTFTAPSAGTYVVDVWGAQGGGSSGYGGGLGAGVAVEVALTVGEEVLVFVGAQGGYGLSAGGGGGSSAALLAPIPTAGLVAGGGGGGALFGSGGNGVAPATGGPGAPGYGGGAGAPGFGGGGGGSYSFVGPAQSLAFKSGDGEVSINAVPEPSTWAMMLSGFAALGGMVLRRKRKITPA